MIPANKIKPRLATDTCSMLFLYQTGLLDRAAEHYTFYITPLILGELEKRADKQEIRAYQNSTVLFNVDGLVGDTFNISNASVADKSLLALYNTKDIAAILSEDGPILRYCKKNDIPHFCCLSLVADMVRKNMMSRELATVYLNKLIKLGRYAEWVIERAYNMLEDK